MSIKVVCGGCQRELRMAPRALGQQVRCPACGLTFMAGQPESAVVADPVPPAPAAAPSEEPLPELLIFSKAPQRPEPGTGWWLPLLALVPLGIAGLGHGDTAPVLVAVTLTAGCLVLALAQTLSRRTRTVAIIGLGAPGYLVLPLAPLFETPAPPEAAWAEAVPAGARCRLEFPGRPSREERRFHRGARRVEVHVVEQSRPYRLFLFSHHPERDEPGVLPLDLMAWKMADSVCRDLRDAWPGPGTPHELSGFPGRQVVIDQGDKGSLTLRVYLIHSTFYLLAAGGEGLGPDSPEVRRFFDSFRPDLTPPEPPGPTAQELRPRAGDRLPEVAVLRWPEFNWPDCVALSPDGKYLALGMTGAEVPRLLIWDVRARKELWSGLADLDQRDSVRRLAFSPDGLELAVTLRDTVRRLDASSGRQRAVLHNQEMSRALLFIPDGTALLGLGSGKLIRWNGALAKEVLARPLVPVLDVWKESATAALAPDGRTLAVCWGDGSVCLHNPAGLQEVARLKSGLPHGKTALAFSPDGRRLAVGGQSQRVQIWDVAGRRAEGELDLGFGGSAEALAWLPGGALAVGNNGLEVYDTRTRKKVLSRELPDAPEEIAVSADGRRLAVIEGWRVRIWDSSALPRPDAP